MPICYAHAAAAVFVLAMSRIVGRVTSVTDPTESYPSFENVKNSLILRDPNGNYIGTSSQQTLQRMTPTYRLNYQEVDENGARNALLQGRPVIARFFLNKTDWTTFSNFYKDSATAILPVGKMTLEKCSCPNKVTCGCGGHAVVLVRCSKDSLTFLNSWGEAFADRGMFKIAGSNCLGDMKFYDVFWRISDLFEIEIENYERKKLQTANAYLQNSATVRETAYCCPSCRTHYQFCEYTGTFDNAICPHGHHFRSDDGLLRAFLWMNEGV